MRFYYFLCAIVLMNLGCRANTNVPVSGPASVPSESATPAHLGASPYQLSVKGALMEMMHEGKLHSRVKLQTTIGKSGLYGLGALEALSGEVMVWDGALWVSRPNTNGGAMATRLSQTSLGAALLVSAEVKAWKSTKVQKSVDSKDIDAFIEREARAAGVDTQKAFPFLLEGAAPLLNWHVIDGTKISSEAHGHQEHMKTAVKGSLSNVSTKILGFYSSQHRGVFTHHDSNTHLHVLAEDAKVMGHVDRIILAEEMTLSFPVR